MRVAVDLDLCEGYANCMIEAPEVFAIDDDTGLAQILMDPVDPAQEVFAEAAIAACPARAIELAP